MRKGTVSRMRERYAQTVLTFRITYVFRTMSEIIRRSPKILKTKIKNDYLANLSNITKHTILQYHCTSLGHAVAKLFEALRYKPEGRGFDARLYNWRCSLT